MCGPGVPWCARTDELFGVEGVHVLAVTTREDGTVPLKTFWNEARGDVATCGTDACVHEQEIAGYVFLRDEGFVYSAPRPGTVPLRLFWNAERQDNATCATDACAADQTSVGYQYIRDEGFVFPATP